MEEEYKDKALIARCKREAGKVDFLHTKTERRLYSTALYNAEMWARQHPSPAPVNPISELMQEKS